MSTSTALAEEVGNGTVLDKNAELESLKSGAVTITKMNASEMNVRIYGNVAVITGPSTILATVRGEKESGDAMPCDLSNPVAPGYF
jgi:hypothetical protein